MVDTSLRNVGRGRFRTAILLVSVLLVLAALVPGCAQEGPPGLQWIRRGRVYLRVEEKGTLRIRVEPANGPANYAYLYGPDGRTLERKLLAKGYSGSLQRPLDAGPGIYVLVPSPSHRMRVSATGADVVFEPETEFPSLFQNSDGTMFSFRVPQGTDRFTFCATNQHAWEGSRAIVRLLRPDGTPETTLEFERLNQDRILEKLGITPEMADHYRSQGDTAEVPEFRLLIERHDVVDPAPGLWRVEAEVTDRKDDDIGFWVEGIDNLFAASDSEPFVPLLEPVRARIRIDSRRSVGPCGDVGVVWGWTIRRDETLETFRELGLTADKHFFPQVDMEAENDDDDPHSIRADGYLFDRFRKRMWAYETQPIPMTSLMAITRLTDWATRNAPEINEYVEACVRYHVDDAGMNPDGLYWQFLNEPNHQYPLEDYVQVFRAAGSRLRETLGSEGFAPRFGGPATGNAWEDREAVAWEWIERLIAEADPELDFVVWNQYRLGRIEDTWRYRAHIERVDSLLRVHDTDGRLEDIVIGATNLRGGIVLQNDRQDGPYSAVWWPSTLCQTLGTGRCRLINYFFLVDQGARRKGLLTAQWEKKPVAVATQFFNRFRKPMVIASETDHDGLDVLATGNERSVSALVVNRTGRAVELDMDIVPPDRSDAGEWSVMISRFDPSLGSSVVDTTHRLSPDESGSGRITTTIGPQSLLGLELRGGTPETEEQ